MVRFLWMLLWTKAAASKLQADHTRKPTFVVDSVVHYCVANMQAPLRGRVPTG